MNTKHFDYVIAIAQTRNLSLASKQLGISQPVLSRYLSQLEDRLGVKLFVQENRKFHITEAGAIYLNGVQRMKEQQTQMFRALDALNGKEELHLSIGMSPFRGGRELAVFYPRLLERYPRLNLTVLEGNHQELLQKLYQQEVSLIINLYDPQLMPGTKAATLTKQEVLIALPSYHPFSRPFELRTDLEQDFLPILSVEQLQSLGDLPFVWQDSHTLAGQAIEQACARYRFTPQTLLRSSNSLAISSLLSSGNYAGFVMQESAVALRNMISFRFPHPLILYSGMIFLEDHEPETAECFLYQLEAEQVTRLTPHIVSINDLGKRLIAGKERIYGHENI